MSLVTVAPAKGLRRRSWGAQTTHLQPVLSVPDVPTANFPRNARDIHALNYKAYSSIPLYLSLPFILYSTLPSLSMVSTLSATFGRVVAQCPVVV